GERLAAGPRLRRVHRHGGLLDGRLADVPGGGDGPVRAGQPAGPAAREPAGGDPAAGRIARQGEPLMDDWLTRLHQDGYAILPAVFAPAEVEAARRAVADALADPAAADSILASEGQPPHGARNLLRLWPGSIALARSPAL